MLTPVDETVMVERRQVFKFSSVRSVDETTRMSALARALTYCVKAPVSPARGEVHREKRETKPI